MIFFHSRLWLRILAQFESSIIRYSLGICQQSKLSIPFRRRHQLEQEWYLNVEAWPTYTLVGVSMSQKTSRTNALNLSFIFLKTFSFHASPHKFLLLRKSTKWCRELCNVTHEGHAVFNHPEPAAEFLHASRLRRTFDLLHLLWNGLNSFAGKDMSVVFDFSFIEDIFLFRVRPAFRRASNVALSDLL